MRSRMALAVAVAQGLRPADVARRVGITRQHAAAVLAGRTRPSMPLAAAIARELRVDPRWLFPELDWPEAVAA